MLFRSGLKKTLVGKNVEKIEKTVKQVKQKLGLQDSVNQKEKPKKEKGFLKIYSKNKPQKFLRFDFMVD